MKSVITSVLTLLVLVSTVALVLLGLAAPASAVIKPVALEGEQSPQSPFLYRKFGLPVVADAAGQRVAVYNRTRGGKRCIFSLDPDSTSDGTVACEKDPSPDGRSFRRLGAPTINTPAASVAWASRLTFGYSGAFRSGPAIVALLGDPVPAPGTGLLDQFSSAHIIDTGDVVFDATISGGAVVLGVEIDAGIFRCTGGDGNCHSGTGTLETLVLVNDPVPDRPGREFCSFIALTDPASLFGIVFGASTKLDCADNAEQPLEGVFRKPFVGAVSTLALQGEPSEPFPAPGGTTYASFVGSPAIENGGDVAFVANTAGIVATSAVYLCDAIGCPAAPADAAVERGQPDDDGDLFRAFSQPAISMAGDIAFSARVDPVSGSGVTHGLYVRRATTDIETIAKTGDPVPGVVPAATFRFLLHPPAMSPGGKIAFKARIRRSVSPRNREGIFIVE
jgi:hypothetical protein